MDKLLSMPCRCCHAILTPRKTDLGVRANSFSECFYICNDCGVAFSNSKDECQRTLIYDQWQRNIPSEVHADLDDCINRSLNVRARPSKLARLAFETSEDAITWTVFRYLQQQGLLGKIFGLTQPRILFWGAEYPTLSASIDLSQELTKVLLELRDDSNSLSEPDIVLVDDDLICTIEVKYRSTNSVQRDHKRFKDYVGAAPRLFKDAKALAKTGYYELTRNLVFTKLLADRLNRHYKVVNLGLPLITTSATKFAKLLDDSCSFEIRIWKELCRGIPLPRPLWFQDYVSRKGLE